MATRCEVYGRKSTRSAAILVVALGALVASCATDPGELPAKAENYRTVDEGLYAASTTLWHTSSIRVCWSFDGSDLEKSWVRDAAQRSWPRYANIDFTGWGRCPSAGFNGIRIRISDTTTDNNPRVSALGSQLARADQSMTLNFTFRNWGTDCALTESDREACIRGITVHEFGHALGFAHEQNRPDTPARCTDAPQGSDGDTTLGRWDLASVMNYCNPKWNNGGLLSAGDMAGVQHLYGARNDGRATALALALKSGESVVGGSTARASADGPHPTGCTAGNNVWFAFDLTERELVYLDTAGSGIDTSLFVTDSAGTPLDALANDDALCTSHEWSFEGTESQVAGVLDPGRYYVAVGGCEAGMFRLHVQHMQTDTAARFFRSPLVGDGSRSGRLTTAVRGSGRDRMWFTTCGGEAQFASVCRSDGSGATFTRANNAGTHDPMLSIVRPGGELMAFGDDGSRLHDCRGTGGDSANVGARIANARVPRGVYAIVIDSVTSTNGMDYTLAYRVR